MDISNKKSPFTFGQRSYTKSQLREVMEFKSRRFTNLLTELEPEIKQNFPWYNKKMQILPPGLVYFIVEAYGCDPEEIKKKLDSI